MTILVTGANGWIGRYCCAEAKRSGLKVVAVGRNFNAGGEWDIYRSADIASDKFVEQTGLSERDKVDAIIHSAGYAHRPSEKVAERASFEAINHRGTVRVVELAWRLNVRRIVYLSSIAFYDWRSGTRFDEDGPLNATTAYAASKLAGEKACLESGLDVRVARLATVFGPGDRANFGKLASALVRRRFVVPGRGTARKSVIPVNLVAELLVDLALREHIDHNVINLGLPSTPTLREICNAYCELCGYARPLAVPHVVLAALASCGDIVERLRGSFPLTSSTLRKLTTDTTVNVARMQSIWPNRKWPDFRTALAESAGYYRGLR